MHLPPLHGLWLAGGLTALFIISVIDVRSRRIPNLLVAPLFAAGLAHAVIGGAMQGALSAIAGASVGVALVLWQHSKGLMGAGDVKLLAAIGAWTGPGAVLAVFLLGSVLGGVLSLVALFTLGRKERGEVGQNLVSLALARGAHIPQPSKLSHARGIPFGVSLSAAAAAVLLYGVWS